MIKASKDIIVIETAINDEVIQQLKTNDLYEDLKVVIDEYARQLKESRVEIFEVGNDFIVTEECVYIAMYEEDLSEQIELNEE